jgi:hypothetical protein
MIYSMSTTLLSCDRRQYQAVGLSTVLEELEDEDRRTPVYVTNYAVAPITDIDTYRS